MRRQCKEDIFENHYNPLRVLSSQIQFRLYRIIFFLSYACQQHLLSQYIAKSFAFTTTILNKQHALSSLKYTRNFAVLN